MTKQLTPAQIAKALKTADAETIKFASQTLAQLESPLYSWQPREDQPAKLDQQTSVVNSKSPITIVLGGTGSGKSEAVGFAVAQFLLQQQRPPKPNTPFWIIAPTLDLSAGVIWNQKLRQFIPEAAIAKNGISYYSAAQEHPKSVRLKHWAGGNNPSWVIEFKAESMGRQKLQAADIGGAWISECLNDWNIFVEIQGRTRSYDWAHIGSSLRRSNHNRNSKQREKAPPPGWSFYHLNSECNKTLAPGFVESYLAGLPEEIRETRRIGAFASYEGCIYKELTNAHIIDPFPIPDDWPRFAAVDFGTHWATVWLAFDPVDERWYVYADYYNESGALIAEHARKMKERGPVSTWYGDPADATSRRELGQHGINCASARKDVAPGIEYVRKLLIANRLSFFRSCTQTIQQMRAYRWAKQHGERDAKPEPLKFWDHCADCVRYGLYSSTRLGIGDSKPFQPLPQFKRRSGPQEDEERARPPAKFRPLSQPPRRSLFGGSQPSRRR